MTTPDPIRAALERLLNAMDGPPCDPFERLKALDAARAALAAAPEGEPSDQELRDLWSWSSGQDQGPWPTQYHCFARAVLSRWGRPAAPLKPVAYIHRQGKHWEVSERLLLDDERARGWTEEPLYATPPAPLEGEVGELVSRLRRVQSLDCARAATLLEQLSAATSAVALVPVSDDAVLSIVESLGMIAMEFAVKAAKHDPEGAHRQMLQEAKQVILEWLPAHALPLPAPQGGEVEA